MKPKLLTFLGVLFLFLWTPAFCGQNDDNQHRISAISVLLPVIYDPHQEDRFVEYHMHADNGCFEWESSSPAVLKVTGLPDPKNPHCHSNALLKVVTATPSNNIVWITARDKDTGNLLKCEARVAEVSKIEILTTIRTIEVGNTETLEVLGYDADGNAFTTLEGLRFEWSLEQDGTFLQFETFRVTLQEIASLTPCP